jgi:hypothetical protein
MPAQKPKLKNMISARSWDVIRDSSLNHIPVFNYRGAKPEPGLEHLATLQQITLPESRQRFPDVAGLRSNLLSEAVFLFHKCAHTHLAAQRLGTIGMHSWSMFNAYHSAYLGARGVMALLGIALPFLTHGGQLLIDVYPEPESPKGKKQLIAGSWIFDEFLLVRLKGALDQSELWNAFQRLMNVSKVSCWKGRAYEELLTMPDEITKPRNAFLYKAAFWPGDDLLVDGNEKDFVSLVGTELSTEQKGFLLRLSCGMYLLFEQLIDDLADASAVIREEIDASRIMSAPNVAELASYNTFLADVGSSGIAQ